MAIFASFQNLLISFPEEFLEVFCSITDMMVLRAITLGHHPSRLPMLQHFKLTPKISHFRPSCLGIGFAKLLGHVWCYFGYVFWKLDNYFHIDYQQPLLEPVFYLLSRENVFQGKRITHKTKILSKTNLIYSRAGLLD